jgi:hypothetical protein
VTIRTSRRFDFACFAKTGPIDSMKRYNPFDESADQHPPAGFAFNFVGESASTKQKIDLTSAFEIHSTS